MNTCFIVIFLRIGGICYFDKNCGSCLRRRFVLCPNYVHYKKWSWGVSSISNILQKGYICLISYYILTVGNLWWMNLINVVLSEWGIFWWFFVVIPAQLSLSLLLTTCKANYLLRLQEIVDVYDGRFCCVCICCWYTLRMVLN